MEAKFFDSEVNYGPDQYGKPTPSKTILFFRLVKESMADKKAESFEFEGPATERHISSYPKQYAEYLKSKEPQVQNVVVPAFPIDLIDQTPIGGVE